MSARLGSVARSLALALASLAVLFPLYWLVTMAIKPWYEWTPAPGTILWYPHHPTLANFEAILGLQRPHAPGFVSPGEPGVIAGSGGAGETTVAPPSVSALRPLANSAVAAGAGTMVALITGLLAAYGISRFRQGGRSFPFLILVVRMVPAYALLLPLLIMLAYLHLFDTLLSLVLVYATFTFPFAVWLLRSYLLALPREIEEAAIIDGCTRWGAFFKAVLPPVKTGIATTAFFVFMLNWSDFQIAYFLTDQTQTGPVYLYSLVGERAAQEYGLQAAMALILIIPTIALGTLVRHQLARGFSLGTIKG